MRTDKRFMANRLATTNKLLQTLGIIPTDYTLTFEQTGGSGKYAYNLVIVGPQRHKIMATGSLAMIDLACDVLYELAWEGAATKDGAR